MSQIPITAFDDPVPDPYDELEVETFEFYKSMGWGPEDISDKAEATRYGEWLNPPLAKIMKSNPFHDKDGKFSTQANDADGKWEKTGSNLGSNPGGSYTHNGQKKYVKFPHAEGQIHAEAAADRIHALMGVGTMDHQPTNVNGKLGSVSVWKEVKPLGADGWKKLTPEQQQDAANTFVASALVKNWDVVGLVHDNMGLDKSGKIHIIDTGGSFQYRAQGEPKKFDGDATAEIKGMLDPSKTSGRVFGPLMKANPDAFKNAAKKLKALPDAQVLEAAKGLGLDKELLDRKASILKYFDV